jgi:hypothetical protein
MRRHPRCRADDCRAPGRGHGGQDNDRPHHRTPRDGAGALGRRHRLWLGGDAGLARRRARDRAAHPGIRQVSPQRWFAVPGRFHPRPCRRCLYLPAGQTGDHPRYAGERRRHPDLSRQQVRLLGLRPETALLPRHAGAQGATQHPRGCTEPGARDLPRPTPTSSPGASGRRSRCCSSTSNASSGSTGRGCEDPAAPETSSSSPPPPRTYASSPN